MKNLNLGSSGLKNTEITQTLSSGNNTVTHNRGIRAAFVTVLNSSNQMVNVDWDNINVNSVRVILAAGSINNAIINIAIPRA